MPRGEYLSQAAVTGGPVDQLLSKVPGARSLARKGVQALNTPLAKARFRQALADADRPYRLEIGGHTPREGWIVTNVNAVTRLYLDATKRWPFADKSVEIVYSDNVIEHLTLEAGRAMLRESHRCLGPGGTIRIVTPDLRAHVEMYLSGEAAMTSAAALHYRDLGLEVEHPIDLVRIPIASFGHHQGYLYDFDTLAAELRRAGFSNVTRRALGTSDHSALQGLDIRGDEGGAQLAVEAVA